MDVLGFGLENYTAIGRWRNQDGKFPSIRGARCPGQDFRQPRRNEGGYCSTTCPKSPAASPRRCSSTRWVEASSLRPPRRRAKSTSSGRPTGYPFRTLIYETVHGLVSVPARRSIPPTAKPTAAQEGGCHPMMTRVKALHRSTFLRRRGHRRGAAVPRRDGSGAGNAANTPSPPSAWPSSMCRTASSTELEHSATKAGSTNVAHPEAARAVQAGHHVFGNLTHNTGRALLDGAGDHGRCCASYLTGVQPRKTIVRYQGRRLLRPDRGQPGGQADPFPLARTRHGRCPPGRRLRFRLLLRVHQQSGLEERNAAAAAGARSARAVRTPLRQWRRAHVRSRARAQNLYRRSILDFVSDDTQETRKQTSGPTDRRKLDEYLSSIREIERQIEKRRKGQHSDRSAHGKALRHPGRFRRALQA